MIICLMLIWKGNSTAHVKASITGSSLQLIVEDGELQLGRWQGIFCLGEFDGPKEKAGLVAVHSRAADYESIPPFSPAGHRG